MIEQHQVALGQQRMIGQHPLEVIRQRLAAGPAVEIHHRIGLGIVAAAGDDRHRHRHLGAARVGPIEGDVQRTAAHPRGVLGGHGHWARTLAVGRRRGRHRRAPMRRIAHRHEPHLVERKLLAHLQRHPQVPVVHGVEGAAENA